MAELILELNRKEIEKLLDGHEISVPLSLGHKEWPTYRKAVIRREQDFEVSILRLGRAWDAMMNQLRVALRISP